MKHLSCIQQRILMGGIFGVFALCLLLFTTKIIFIAFIVLLFLVMFFEYSAVCTKKQISPLLFAFIIFFAARSYDFFSNVCCYSVEITTWLLQQSSIAFFFLAISFAFRKGRFQQVFVFFFGCIWLVLPFFFFLGIIYFPNFKINILFLILIIVANDSFAYFVGKRWGKRKITPSISPNKTYLGSFAGFISALVVALILQYFWQVFNYFNAVFIASVLALTGQFGDLLASKVKRIYQVKDYGRILPAHGGIIDRLDALMLAIPAYYFFLSYLQ